MVVREGVTWSSQGVALQGVPSGGDRVLSDLDVEVHGVVIGGYAALDLESAVSAVHDSEITVGRTGFVGSLDNAIVLRGGRDNEIVNHGLIYGSESAIRAGGADLGIENHGLIGTFGDDQGSAPRYNAISITQGDAKIVNAGGIVGYEGVARPWDQVVIQVAKDARLELVNEAGALVGVPQDSGTAIVAGHRGDLVTNRGAIVSDVELRGGADVVVNEGVIDGDLRLGRGDDRVEAEGEITGVVSLGGGDDRFERRDEGAAPIRVSGGEGDDLYVVAAGAARIREGEGGGYDTVRLVAPFEGRWAGEFRLADHVEKVVIVGDAGADVTGNASRNVMRGGAGDDRLDGGAGADRIAGRRGDDEIEGGRGRDRIAGGNGDDAIEGGAGRDVIRGGRDADDLDGGAGSDVLRGGRGGDRLDGGGGADKLAGGGGADVFVWAGARDAGTGRGRDVVTDFRSGRDVLDFEGMDLTYREGGFSGEGAEIRAVEKGSRTILRVDADGDGDSDMTIALRGVTGLGEDDLLL